MKFSLVLSVLIIGMLSSCHQYTGMYTPSFEGARTVYEKGQWVHSTNLGSYIGKYVNYSPFKNVAVFGDFRFNQYKPQGSIALGMYKSKYTRKTFNLRGNQDVIRSVGAHFDTYIGFAYHEGIENYGYEAPIFNRPSYQSDNLIYYTNYRAFWQLGGHFSFATIKFDLVYRWNRIDIEKLVYFPEDSSKDFYVNRIADHNPLSIHEMQTMVSFGGDKLQLNLLANIILPVASQPIPEFSNFSQVQIGLSYLLNTFDKK